MRILFVLSIKLTFSNSLERYTAAERSQHLIHHDPRIFGTSYVAHTSSVNGRNAFLDEPKSHIAVDYLQGLEQFREVGLPLRLPTQLWNEILTDSEVLRLDQLLQSCKVNTDEFKEIKNHIRNSKARLKTIKLKQHQRDWMKERREMKIVTRGRKIADTQQQRCAKLLDFIVSGEKNDSRADTG